MRMIPKKETITIEFKSDIECLDEKELVSEIVGMANTEGGILYLGVEDDGEITGVHKRHNDPNGAMALIANKTDNTSIENQKKIIEEFVKAKFPTCKLSIYEDRDRSGYTFEQREGYQQLSKKLMNGDISVLIVKDFS